MAFLLSPVHNIYSVRLTTWSSPHFVESHCGSSYSLLGTGNNTTISMTLVGEWGFSCGTGKIQSTLPFFLNFPSSGNFGQELTNFGFGNS